MKGIFCAFVLTLIGTSVVHAVVIAFDPDGLAAGNGPVNIGGLDLAPGNGLLQNSGTFPVGATFQYVHQASVSALTDSNGNPLNTPGLNTSFELTHVSNTTMQVTSTGNNTVTYAVAPVQSPLSYFEIWYDPTPDANPLAGTGYNDGQRIYLSAPSNTLPGSGNLTTTQAGGGGALIQQFDQFGANDYPGITSAVLNGSNQHGDLTSFADATFFQTAIARDELVTSTSAPFVLTNPSHLFATLVNGGPLAPALVGTVNGVNGTDTQVMADGLLVFTPVPEPTTALVAPVALLLCARRRR